MERLAIHYIVLLLWLHVVYQWKVTLADFSDAAPYFTHEPESRIVAPGASVSLQCRVEPADVHVRWTFNKRYISTTATSSSSSDSINANSLGISVSNGLLRIESFQTADSANGGHVGIYQCVANNTVGLVVSREAKLQAAYISSYDSDLEDLELTVTAGNVARIPCPPIDSLPARKALFEKDGSTLTGSNSRHHILPSGNLQIANVKRSDQGTYRCVSVNPLTSQKRTAPFSVTLTVKAPVQKQATTVVEHIASEYSVKRGDNLTLECVMNGAPVPRVTWSKFGGKLPEGRHQQVLGNLILTDLHIEDQGTYVCEASNTIGPRKSTHGYLYVKESASIRRPPKDQAVRQGGDITLECVLRGTQPISKQWLFNGNVLQAGESIEITVARPVITVPPANVTVTPGSTVVLTCQTAREQQQQQDGRRRDMSTSYRHVAWSRDDVMLISDTGPEQPQTTSDRRYKMANSGDLNVFNVRRSDAGRYTCRVSNAAGYVTASAYLHVSDNAGDASDPDASTTPRPANTDTGRQRPRTKGRNRGRNRELPRVMPEEDEEDADEEGEEGKKKKNRRNEERVIVPPSQPSVSQLSDTSVKVQWDVPEVDNAYDVSFFKIQYKQLDNPNNKRWRTIDEDIQARTRVHEVAGLKPGGTYRFRIVAVFSNNDNKQGPNSRKFTLDLAPIHRPRPPISGPVIVQARPISTTQISIEWQYLPEDRSPIEGFFVLFKPYESSGPYKKHTIPSTLKRKHIIDNLQPSTQYSILMLSFNTAGESQIANTVVKKTLALNGETPLFGLSPLPDTSPLYPDGGGGGKTKNTDDDASRYLNNEHNTAASHGMLYWILGIVLGIMLLVLVFFMVLCACKQRQNRNAMVNRNKYKDPAKSIYTDSLRKTQNGGPHFLLNGLNGGGGVGNGGIPGNNGHAVTYTPTNSSNGNGGVNLHINPFQTEEPQLNGNNLQELRSSLQEMLQSPPPPPNNNYDEVAALRDDEEEVSECEQCAAEDCPSPGSDCTPYQPPEYHSLLRQHPHNNSSPSNTGSGNSRHMSSFKPRRTAHSSSSLKRSTDNGNASPDHIPRLHERRPLTSGGYALGAAVTPPTTMDLDAVGGDDAVVVGSYVPPPQHDSPPIIPSGDQYGASPSPPPPPLPPGRGSSSVRKPSYSDSPQLPPRRPHYDPNTAPPQFSPASGGGGGRYDSNPASPLTGRYDSPPGARYDSPSSPLQGGGRYDSIPPAHYEQIQQDILESEQSQSSSSSQKAKRKRRKHRGSQGTNTDHSSNEGTLDSHLGSLDSSSPPHQGGTPTPPARHHHNVPPAGAPPPLYTHNVPLRYHDDEDDSYNRMLPRANDYPPSDQDELED